VTKVRLKKGEKKLSVSKGNKAGVAIRDNRDDRSWVTPNIRCSYMDAAEFFFDLKDFLERDQTGRGVLDHVAKRRRRERVGEDGHDIRHQTVKRYP
jgi:hypothetical protein